MTRFPQSLDTTARIVTVLVWGLLLAVLVQAFVAEGAGPVSLGVGALLVALLCVGVAGHPRWVEVSTDGIAVGSGAWPPFRLAADDVEAISAVDLEVLRITLRLFGSGGFHGFWGLFLTAEGRMRLFATRRRGRCVLVRRRRGVPLVLTPDDLDGLLREAARAGLPVSGD